MQTNRTYIESFTKKSSKSPWIVSIASPYTSQLIRITVGDGGETEVGPRLSEVLSLMERKIDAFPFQFTYSKLELASANDYTAKVLGDYLVYLEASVDTYRILLQKDFIKYGTMEFGRGIIDRIPHVKGWAHEHDGELTTASETQLESGSGGNGLRYETTNNTDYVIITERVSADVATDGDTFNLTGRIAGFGEKTGQVLTVDSEVEVRFVGINTPETWGTDEYKQEKNSPFATRYKIPLEDAHKIGEEAKNFNKVNVLGKVLVVDLDTDENGNLAKDNHDRYVGVVYVLPGNTTVSDVLSTGVNYGLHLNKTLLATRSSINPIAPLAMPYDHYIDSVGYRRFNVVQWLYELGIRDLENIDSGDDIKDIEIDIDYGEDIDVVIADAEPVKIRHQESSSNRIEFLKPLDDRQEDIWGDAGIDSRVRIGDVALVIPPIAIQVNRTSTLEKVKTLRSKSSIITKTTGSATMITLQLYFHDMESINGHAWDNEHGATYFMDGLRPLIAQFKKAPFLPIDNEYINNTLGIDDVALVNMSVRTVPGFPNSISATLTLSKFDLSPYMPGEASLGDVINYPMLRWYYQESMKQPESPYRTYLKPITSELSNAFKFQLADEAQLITRKNAIMNIRNMDTPTILKSKIENKDTELGKLVADGEAVQKIVKQYERYLEVKADGLVPKADESGFIDEQDLMDALSSNEDSREAWKYIYESEKKAAGYAQFRAYETKWFFTADGGLTGERQEANPHVYAPENWYNGWFIVPLYADTNASLFPEYMKTTLDGYTKKEAKTLVIPANEIETLKQIITRGYEAISSANQKIAEYHDMKALIDQTEGKLDMLDFPVSGLIPISLSVMYENSVVPIQMQQNDSPTLQYLGSQDPYIEVTFHADQDGVSSLKDLLTEAERYSNEYRLGITSGFIGFENQLTELFGVTTVMPESVIINTLQGFPGTFEIQMVLCGFDKTQRRMEALEGLSPIYGDPDREDRKTSNYSMSRDMAIIEHRMKDLEAYPDLELPEYAELQAALPKIGAMVDNDHYENRTGARFVDPDFYIATEWTMREHMRQEREKEHRMEFDDFAGIKMFTSSKDGAPINADKEMWELIYKLDDETPNVGTAFTEDGTSIGNQTAIRGTYGQVIEAPADVATIQEWLSSTNAMLIPTLSDYMSWHGGPHSTVMNSYENWLGKMQPTEAEVYRVIYSSIDKHWTDIGLIYDDRDDSGESWEKATYGTVDDVWRANYNGILAVRPNLTADKLDEGNIKTSDYKKYRPITRERLANYIKSIIHAQSKWQHLRGDGKPKTTFNKSSGTYYGGIGFIDISAHARDVEMAQRLLWDWKYNLEYTIEYLYKIYIQAGSSDDINKYSRPWDWMAHGFGAGTFKDSIEDIYYLRILKIFKDKYNIASAQFATPTAAVEPALMREREGLTDHEYRIITGEKDALLEELKKMGMKKNKLEGLKDKSTEEVREVYEKFMYDKFEKGDEEMKNHVGSDNTMSVGKQIENAKNREESPDEWEKYQRYKELRKIVNEETNRLVSDVDPETLFLEMFTDMIDYDMRGRLARAFPTFQMFIVDEGKWMTNYRMWDNLYGFNAIQSIDVHRSRENIADTAVISMTNVYSNLTSRPMSQTYEDFEFDFWDNLVFGNPNELMIDARKQLLDSMMLKTGARMHLRMGYGSSVQHLPVMFNGTITELETGEVITLIAQGDGLELTNVISADPDDNNREWYGAVQEPRDLICELMTSKGNWFKDAINWTSEGKFFKDNPLGIQHFGSPAKTVWANVGWNPYNNNYGEAAQNIYSSNGLNTFSQWAYQRTQGVGEEGYGDEVDNEPIPWDWKGFWTDWEPGDEDNVLINFNGQTVWDIVGALSYTSPDYIAAVHPFEMRSTLFFGKPYWRMAYRYDSTYTWSSEQEQWERVLDMEHRKPYMQFHIVDSHMDIVQNRIKASEDQVKTVVIAEYEGGKPTNPIYADYDIYYSKQKTAVVKAPILADFKLANFWTSEKQAIYYGMSALRDYMKKMYQGQLVMLGTPTLKPHDMVYMNDTMHDMSGNFLVRSVTHHFSYETGFITNVEPDLLVVNDDKAMMAISNWIASVGIVVGSAITGIVASKLAKRKFVNSSLGRKAIKYSKKGGRAAIEQALKQIVKTLPDDDPDIGNFKTAFKLYLEADTDDAREEAKALMKEHADKLEGKVAQWEADGKFKTEYGKDVKAFSKGSKFYMKRLVSTTRRMSDALSDGTKAFKAIRGVALVSRLHPLSIIAGLVIEWGVETLLEKWRRKKAMAQAVLAMPLHYQGRPYTAGINGHKGMVVGDNKMGKMDAFYSGAGFYEDEADIWGLYADVMNGLSGSDKDYIIGDDELNKVSD